MNRPIWITLAMLHDVKNPLVDWRRLLEGYFDCVQRYLEKCPGEIASTIPCPGSNLRFEVGKREGMYVAYPEEGFEGDAESLSDLTEDDVALWRLELGRFELDLSRAMGLVPLERTAGLSNLLSLIGTAGQGKIRKRVYLGYASNERAGVDMCLAAARESQGPCCVALPAFYPACDELLRRSDFEYIVLEEAVILGVSGIVGKRPVFVDSVTPRAESARAPSGNETPIELARQLDAIEDKTNRVLKHVEGAPLLVEKAVIPKRARGKDGGRTPNDGQEQIKKAVAKVLELRDFNKSKSMTMERACKNAIKEMMLSIKWQALAKQVRQSPKWEALKKRINITRK